MAKVNRSAVYVRVNVQRRSAEWEDPFAEDGRLRQAQIFSLVPTREDRELLKAWQEFYEPTLAVDS